MRIASSTDRRSTAVKAATRERSRCFEAAAIYQWTERGSTIERLIWRLPLNSFKRRDKRIGRKLGSVDDTEGSIQRQRFHRRPRLYPILTYSSFIIWYSTQTSTKRVHAVSISTQSHHTVTVIN